MSSSLTRNSNVRKSFRLEITLERSYVESSGSPDSPEGTLKSDVPSSSKREFANARNWNSDPKLLLSNEETPNVAKSSSSGNLAKKLLKPGKNNKSKSKQTMSQADGANGTSSQKTKSKSGPVSRIKTVIRSTKETIIERLPGGSSKDFPGWHLQRSRPKSVGASHRYGVYCNGNIHQREPSLSPPRNRKTAAKIDRSRSFNVKSRVNVDGFVAKRCEVWERKSRDSSPERTAFLPADLPSSGTDRKSFIKQRTAMLFEPQASESSLPNKKQLLLDLNGRTPKGTPGQSKSSKPQLKPKRVNLFKPGVPVKPTDILSRDTGDKKNPTSPNSWLHRNRSSMGKTCSIHQEGSVIEDDYGIDALKTGYDHYTNCNGVVTSPNHSTNEKSPEKRSIKYEKENQNVVLPKTSKHRTTSNSSKAQESVQSNGCVPNGVLTERLDKNRPTNEVTDKPREIPKRQTVATLSGVKLVDEVFDNTEEIKRTDKAVLSDNGKDEDDVFENCGFVDKKGAVLTLNGVKLIEQEQKKDGYYFIDVVNRIQAELEELSRRADIDMESELPEEASGRLRAAIGKNNLLTTKKFRQFRGLCEENNHPKEGTGSKVPTSEDLAGFWDMVMLQVDDVKAMFEEIDFMRKNGWQSPKRASQAKPLEVRTPTRKIRTKARPKVTTPNTKNALKDAERAAKAKQQREEARRRLLAAKKAMRRRTLSGSLSDEGGVEIFC